MDEGQLAEMEAQAVMMARDAGLILEGHFGVPMDVAYKDENKRDPVTPADKESQELLTKAISKRFPEHGIIGEEDMEEGDEIAPDFVWVLDPLDGTKNFLSGLPLFACSIGVLHRGAPVVGALYLPWPGERHGVVMHARRGGGAFVEGKPLGVFRGVEPEGNRLATLPASFGGGFRIGAKMRDKVGDVRVTGSIAYELAMTASGVLQYSITTRPRLWDVAGGASLVQEAGGLVMIEQRQVTRWPLASRRVRWEPLRSFTPGWRSGTTTLNELRQWSAPLVLGGPEVAAYVARGLRSRSPLRRRLARATRRLKRVGRPIEGRR